MLPMSLKVEVSGGLPSGEAMAFGIRKGVTRALETVKLEAMRNLSNVVLKRRTGKLASSLTTALYTQGQTVIGLVGTNVKYGKWHEFGLPGPWTIRAKGDGMLHFKIGGADFFRKQVKHPGLRSRPWLRPALASVQPHLKTIMTDEISRVLIAKGSGGG